MIVPQHGRSPHLATPAALRTFFAQAPICAHGSGALKSTLRTLATGSHGRQRKRRGRSYQATNADASATPDMLTRHTALIGASAIGLAGAVARRRHHLAQGLLGFRGLAQALL